eukprot:scaffold136597_cov31-Tisochrysis_lutea.AAC.3
MPFSRSLRACARPSCHDGCARTTPHGVVRYSRKVLSPAVASIEEHASTRAAWPPHRGTRTWMTSGEKEHSSSSLWPQHRVTGETLAYGDSAPATSSKVSAPDRVSATIVSQLAAPSCRPSVRNANDAIGSTWPTIGSCVPRSAAEETRKSTVVS